MLEKIPKLSVMIITYNQENVISRAIDSLLCQKDCIYEICVSDDCSKDGTWEILQSYSLNYPGLFKLNRNISNVGIFENSEKVWTMPTGDVVYLMAGDDECGEGWLEKVQNFIVDKNIDYKKELFCIYGDYKSVYPNGDYYVYKNKAITTGIDPIRLTLRALIGNRSACYSKKVLDKFEKVSQGKSHIAESAQDKQLQLFSETNYYIPHVGNIYYSGIGVSSTFNKESLQDRELIEPYAQTFIEKHGYKFCKKDLNYLKFLEESAKAYRNKSIGYKLRLLWLYTKGVDCVFGLKGLKLKRFLFAIARRLPHSKPINWTL